MLQRRRAPGIDPRPAKPTKGLEHLQHEWVVILRWLVEGHVEHVVVGPVAEAIRGRVDVGGTVTIVPAPYRRNLDRLASSLLGANARLRTDDDAAETTSMRFSAAALAAGERWKIRCGIHELDIEMASASRYPELLYEAGRFEIEPGVSVEVGSSEDLEHHSPLRRTGEEPEIRISRGPGVPQSAG